MFACSVLYYYVSMLLVLCLVSLCDQLLEADVMTDDKTGSLALTLFIQGCLGSLTCLGIEHFKYKAPSNISFAPNQLSTSHPSLSNIHASLLRMNKQALLLKLSSLLTTTIPASLFRVNKPACLLKLSSLPTTKYPCIHMED